MNLHAIDLKNGPAAAALLGAGLGSLYLGLFTTLNELSAAVHDFLTWSDAVGPLSGKVGVALILWLLTWVGLHLAWKDKDVDLNRTVMVTLVLVGLGFLGTFPPFFLAFAGE
jgi:hypothetical protein